MKVYRYEIRAYINYKLAVSIEMFDNNILEVCKMIICMLISHNSPNTQISLYDIYRQRNVVLILPNNKMDRFDICGGLLMKTILRLYGFNKIKIRR